MKEIGEEIPEATILKAGDGNIKWKKGRLLKDFTCDDPSLKPRIVLSTNQTASSEEFLRKVEAGPHLMVAADECHQTGSTENSAVYTIDAGKRLRLARNESGMSQTKAGKLVGVTHQQVQKYEWNINRISVGRCMQFAEAFNIPITDFFPLRDRYYTDDVTPPAAFKIIKLLSQIDPELHDRVHDVVKAFARSAKRRKG